VDLEQILCHEEARTVARDNTVVLDRVVFQIDKQRGRRSCAGLPVLVRRHLDGRHSIWWGPRCLGRYTATGRPLVTRAGCPVLPLKADRPLVKLDWTDHLSTTADVSAARTDRR